MTSRLGLSNLSILETYNTNDYNPRCRMKLPLQLCWSGIFLHFELVLLLMGFLFRYQNKSAYIVWLLSKLPSRVFTNQCVNSPSKFVWEMLQNSIRLPTFFQKSGCQRTPILYLIRKHMPPGWHYFTVKQKNKIIVTVGSEFSKLPHFYHLADCCCYCALCTGYDSVRQVYQESVSHQRLH